MVYVAVVGLGFVGLTLSIVASKKGYKVFGIDTNSEILDQLSIDKSHFYEKDIDALIQSVSGNSFFYGKEFGDFEDIKSCLEESIGKGKTAEDTDLLSGVKITASTGIEYSGSRQSFQLETETWSKTSTDSDKINVAATISKFDEMLAKTKKERKWYF